MKKIFSYVFIALLSASLSIYLINGFSSKEKDLVKENYSSDPIEVHQTAFNPGMAVTGPDFRVAAQNSVHAVVHIRSQFENRSRGYDDFFGSLRELLERNQGSRPRSNTLIGFGSGVIISDDGYIVTNNHVVQGASKIEVTLNDKKLYEGELVGTDPNTDLALIKIDAEHLPYLVYGNSDEVLIGEWVLAVGNPFNLTSTVTAGIVSAKARNINILGSNTAIESFIQTDAAVNRGNSGGALVNDKGELIGINAAIASHTGSYEGYSFAIPINIVKKVVGDLLEFGYTQRAYLGITIRELDAELANELDIKHLDGVYINSVSEDGSADKAGIKASDIITSVEGTAVNTSSELLEVLGQHRPGDELKVEINRNDKQLLFDVTLQNERGSISMVQKASEFSIEKLGATFIEVPSNEKSSLNLRYGLKIKSLSKGLLKNGGVRKGFIILKINDIRIQSQNDIEYAINNIENNFLKISGVYPNGMRIVYGFE